jgi:hypothetical protein
MELEKNITYSISSNITIKMEKLSSFSLKPEG